MIDLKLNSYLQPLDAPVTQPRAVSGFTFEMANEVQLKKIKVSSIDAVTLVRATSISIGTSANFGTAYDNGVILNLNSTLSAATGFPWRLGYQLMGIPFINIYQGTVIDEDYQIFPHSGSSLGTTYRALGNAFDGSSSGGSFLTNVARVENVSAGVQPYVVWQTWWKYISNYQGQGSGGTV